MLLIFYARPWVRMCMRILLAPFFMAASKAAVLLAWNQVYIMDEFAEFFIQFFIFWTF